MTGDDRSRDDVMTATHESRYEDWLPAYALGALDGEELRELEAHLATGCDRCAGMLTGWEGDLAALAAEAPAVEPSEVTRQRLMRKVAEEAPTRSPVVARDRSRPRRALAGWALAASLAAVALSLGALWSQLRTSEDLRTDLADRTSMERELERLQEELGRTRAELGGLRTHVERLAVSVQSLGGGGRSYLLAGLEGAPEAGGATFVDPRTHRAVFYTYGLPAAPPGKTYQLWWIAEGKPVSAGIFDVDETGTGSLEITGEPPADIDLWAVTIEPEGGVPQPTGDMVLKS